MISNNSLDLSWTFNEIGDEIVIEQYGQIVMRIGLCEVIDSMKPEIVLGHIETIRTCPWTVGKWKEYFNKKCLEKFEL